MSVKDFFATKLQTNAVISMACMLGLQIYILVQMNGHFAELIMTGDPCSVATVLAPALAIVWIGKTFAAGKDNFDE